MSMFLCSGGSGLTVWGGVKVPEQQLMVIDFYGHSGNEAPLHEGVVVVGGICIIFSSLDLSA